MQARLGSATADYYMIGYERLKLEDLYRILKEAGIRCLVDVRDSPWSRVPDYRKNALEKKLDELGEKCDHRIRYVSMPALGNPAENRKSDRSGAEMMAFYRRHVSAKTRELDELRDTITSCRTALLCYEADPSQCHRSELAALLEERYGLTYVDLRMFESKEVKEPREKRIGRSGSSGRNEKTETGE